MEFSEFCSFLEDIKALKSQNEKRDLIRERFKKFRNEDKTDFFQILRLMVPSLDRERDSYNMKEAKVARTIIKLLDLPPGHDQTVLSKSYLMAGQATDFGDIVYSVIRKYLSSYKVKFTVEDANKFFEDLSKRSKESEAEDLMMKTFEKMSPECIRWIIRIILKDLKLGIGSNPILNCYHKDAASYYASNNSLRKVCEVLKDENVKLHELVIEIFEPFRPMLSKRIEQSNFKKEFTDNKLYFVENKFDGERFQIHMEDGKFRYFSRNGFNFTDHLGDTYNAGVYTPKLKGIFNTQVKKVILDGEMMLWDKRRSCYGSKGMTWDVKKLTPDSPYQSCFCVYDIILLNDRILTGHPLKERKEILNTVFENTKVGVIEISSIKEVKSLQEIIDELNLAVHKEEEGIIVKDPESIYKYSDRNSGWYKMKLDYFQDVMNDLDLILMGGSYTSTSDILNSFIVGIRSGNADNGRPLYLSFGSVSSGLNKDELAIMNKKLKTEGHKFEQFNSKELVFSKEKPHYYIDPSNSVVFQIRATELVRNTDSRFKTPFSLRFPRILEIRYDKPIDECLDMNELLELTTTNKAVIKLNRRNISLEELMKTKTRKVKHKTIQMPMILDTRKVSDILEGYHIYVLNGTDDFDKETAGSYIKRAGGTLLYRATEKTDIMLAGRYTDKVKEYVRSRPKYDIINLNWLKRTIKDGNLLGYQQEDVYYLGYNYKNCLSDELDRYGDSYTEPTTVEKLKRTFEIIRDMGVTSNQNGSVRIQKTWNDFSQYTAYFDKYDILEDSSSPVIYESFLDEMNFLFYNGNVTDTIAKANLVIYNGEETRRKLIEEHVFTNDFDILVKPKTFLSQL